MLVFPHHLLYVDFNSWPVVSPHSYISASVVQHTVTANHLKLVTEAAAALRNRVVLSALPILCCISYSHHKSLLLFKSPIPSKAGLQFQTRSPSLICAYLHLSHQSFQFLGDNQKRRHLQRTLRLPRKCLNVLCLQDAKGRPAFKLKNSFDCRALRLRFVKPHYTADVPPVSLQVNCPLVIKLLGAST